jgi:hypothetical protein
MSTDPIYGYHHLHATGIRTFNLLIAFSEGANHAVEEILKGVTLTLIKSNIKENDLPTLTNFREVVLPALLSHPHVASAYIIGTGEEPIPLYTIIGELLAINSATEYLSINNGTDEAMAVKIAVSGATDLSTQSLPGLREIENPKVIAAYAKEPKTLKALIAQAEDFGIELEVRQFSTDPYADLQAWMLEGVHAIVAFTPDDLYPVGTLLTPVINISSGSEFHNRFAGDFDIESEDTSERILEELLGVLSRVRTFSEYTKTSLPVMRLPLRRPNSDNPLHLAVINDALGSLAIDVATYFPHVDFLGTVTNWTELLTAPESLIILTTGSAFEVELLVRAPKGLHILDLSEVGSLGALAEAAAQFISQHK